MNETKKRLAGNGTTKEKTMTAKQLEPSTGHVEQPLERNTRPMNHSLKAS